MKDKDFRAGTPKFLFETALDILQVHGAIFGEIDSIKDASAYPSGIEQNDD